LNLFKTKIIVIGSLNTDLIGFGVDRILGGGELTLGGEFIVAPGGKSRNIAEMIAQLTPSDSVSMIGLTSQDPLGLWKIPFDALNKSGVSTAYIKILDFKVTKKYPGLALIPVDKKGTNQIYVLPGISTDLSSQHILEAEPIFLSAEKNDGFLILTLEMPIDTAIFSIKLANKHGLKVIFDPGGIKENENYKKLLEEEILLIKPNEHEIKILTGVTVNGFKSAKKAANILLNKKIKNVLITVGSKGAYFFNARSSFEIPALKIDSTIKDETGCGDQVTATFCAMLLKDIELLTAIEIAVKSGGLQLQKPGVQPLLLKEIQSLISHNQT